MISSMCLKVIKRGKMYVWYSPMTFECSALFENNTLVNENKRTHIFNNLTCITLFSHSSGNSFGNIFVISQQANFLSNSARSRIRLIFTTFSQHFFNIWHVWRFGSWFLASWSIIFKSNHYVFHIEAYACNCIREELQVLLFLESF